MPWIIVAGGIFTGHRFIGPFADEGAAMAYASVAWHEGVLEPGGVVMLEPPDGHTHWRAPQGADPWLIIVAGELVNGFRFIGPFADEDAVNAYVDGDAGAHADALGDLLRNALDGDAKPEQHAAEWETHRAFIDADAGGHDKELDDLWISAALEPPEVADVPDVRSGSPTMPRPH
jgi:hypothetical protein